MGIPQIIIIVIFGMGLGMHLVKHGEERKQKYNFWATLLATAINVGLLIWGGFFS